MHTHMAQTIIKNIRDTSKTFQKVYTFYTSTLTYLQHNMALNYHNFLFSTRYNQSFSISFFLDIKVYCFKLFSLHWIRYHHMCDMVFWETNFLEFLLILFNSSLICNTNFIDSLNMYLHFILMKFSRKFSSSNLSWCEQVDLKSSCHFYI